MKYFFAITILLSFLFFPLLSNADNRGLSSLNPRDSILNPNNSELNPQNSSLNPQNSPLNPNNSPLNPNRQNGIYDSEGHSVGYTTPKAGGGVNIFDNEGHRKGYSTE